MESQVHIGRIDRRGREICDGGDHDLGTGVADRVITDAGLKSLDIGGAGSEGRARIPDVEQVLAGVGGKADTGSWRLQE